LGGETVEHLDGRHETHGEGGAGNLGVQVALVLVLDRAAEKIR
jgi:hypothetical protein